MLFSHSVLCPQPPRKSAGIIVKSVAHSTARGIFKYFFIFFIPFAILSISERSFLFP